MMGERVPFATKINSELRDKIQKLSKDTRIPQSKLVDEALEDLIKKYNCINEK
jgi:predicted DNA-binding protein